MSEPDRNTLTEIAQRWVSLWNAPVDWLLFHKLHAADFVDESPSGRPPNRTGFAQGLRELLYAFPDLTTHVKELVIDMTKSRVAVRWAALGTNRAAFLGIGPTHKKTPITGIEIIEIHGGQITRRWGEWDITGHR